MQTPLKTEVITAPAVVQVQVAALVCPLLGKTA
jgi:hypothetical protein